MAWDSKAYDRKKYWRTKKPCLDCGELIAFDSKRCCSCNSVLRKKSDEIKLLVKRRAARRCSRVKTEEFKQKIYQKLGDKCVCCGFSDKRALHVDHVNNDGYSDRKRWKSVWQKLKEILSDTTGKYQILCANCNFIKRHETLSKKDELKDASERQTINSGINYSSRLGNLQDIAVRPGQVGGEPIGSSVPQGQVTG